jgi:hypothetical protein
MRSFIKARLNKDNFWNLMFCLLMFVGVTIAFATDTMILSWITIIGVVWLVKRNSEITFNKDNLEFVINGNKRIKTSGKEFILLMFVSFGFMALIGLILDSLTIDENLAVYNLVFWFVPTMYFILKNLPIAIIFNKTSWTKGNGTSVFDSSSSDWKNNYRHLSTNSDSKITCMSYDYLLGNMYHRSYLDRYRK